MGSVTRLFAREEVATLFRMVFEPYFNAAPLDGYYFEDSYVLDLTVSGSSAFFIVDAVLTPKHPRFRPAKPGEQYAYELIQLRFENATELKFEPSNAKPNVGPDGSTDLGNIDSFEVGEEGTFLLEGEFGQLVLREATLTVLEDPEPK